MAAGLVRRSVQRRFTSLRPSGATTRSTSRLVRLAASQPLRDAGVVCRGMPGSPGPSAPSHRSLCDRVVQARFSCQRDARGLDGARRRPGMRVLVVEDEARAGRRAAGRAGGRGLRRRRGPRRARRAVDGAENTPYDAIVLDIMLPGLNGYRVCAQLRADGIWTPILMLTAKDGEYDEAEALDTGADDYLDQAVLVRGAAGPAAGADAPRRAASGRPCSKPATSGRPGHAGACARRRRGRADQPGVRRCSSSCCAGRARCVSKQRRSSTTCGTTTSRATPTSSRSTSATCATSSTGPFGRTAIETVRGAGYRLAADGG